MMTLKKDTNVVANGSDEKAYSYDVLVKKLEKVEAMIDENIPGSKKYIKCLKKRDEYKAAMKKTKEYKKKHPEEEEEDNDEKEEESSKGKGVGFAVDPPKEEEDDDEVPKKSIGFADTTTTTAPAAPALKPALKSALKKPGDKKKKKSARFGGFDEGALSRLSSVCKDKSSVQSDGGVKWRKSVQEQRISLLRGSIIDDLFYTSDEIADFRYNKFMEECGLADEDFDDIEEGDEE